MADMTKADLRALRETVGLSQQQLADLANVSREAIKRWENDSYDWQAHPDVWALLYSLRARQREAVDAALDFADTMPDDDPRETVISYYRSQAQYDSCHPDGGLYTVANATARAIGMALELDDLPVRYEYPHAVQD